MLWDGVKPCGGKNRWIEIKRGVVWKYNFIFLICRQEPFWRQRIDFYDAFQADPVIWQALPFVFPANIQVTGLFGFSCRQFPAAP